MGSSQKHVVPAMKPLDAAIFGGLVSFFALHVWGGYMGIDTVGFMPQLVFGATSCGLHWLLAKFHIWRSLREQP